MGLVIAFVISHTDYLLAALVAYFCGCFNGAILTSRLFFHDDVRRHGSGNAGLTNFYRNYGAKYALLVILCDMGKAAVAVLFAAWLGARFDPRMMPDLPLTAAEQAVYVLHFKYWAGLFCVLGHMFPCTAKFKGGKGILCSGMLLLCLDWRIALVCWGLFALLWLTTRYVSLGSVSAAVAFPVLTQIVYGDLYLTILSVLIAALVIFAHRENIVRLLHGTENRFHFHVNAPEDKK